MWAGRLLYYTLYQKIKNLTTVKLQKEINAVFRLKAFCVWRYVLIFILVVESSNLNIFFRKF